jgi:TniQ
VGRPLQRSQEQLIPDKLSAGGSLVIRARPKEDESYLGFLLRLAEINSFDTPYWILKIMGAGSSTFRTYSAEASARLSLRLASLSKLSVKDLEHLYNRPVRGKYLLSFFDHPVPPYLLRPGRPRVCPKCLSQSQYCRKQWDFAAITSCPTHQIMLLEKCPGCGKPITWLRRSVSHCRCGTDWRQTQTVRLSKSEIVVSQLIYKEFQLPCPQILKPRDNNPLYDVDLPSLLSALFLITSQQEGRNGDTLGKHIFQGELPLKCTEGF